MEFHEFDVNVTWVRYWFKQDYLLTECTYPRDYQGDKGIQQARSFHSDEIPINRTLLSLEVNHGAVNCVAYLKEMGACSRGRLPGSGYDTDSLPNGYTGYKLYTEITADLEDKSEAYKYFGASYRIQQKFHTAEYNTLQLASLKYGRDSLITRLVRGETRASLLTLKRDSRDRAGCWNGSTRC